MRIVHIIPSLEVAWGGPARVALELTSALAKRGHSVELLAARGEGELFDLSPARASNVDVKLFPVEAPRFFKYSPQMRKHFLRILPDTDIIHLHAIYLYPTWMVGRHAAQHAVPYVFSPHGALDPFVVHYRRRWQKRMLGLLYHDAMIRRAAAVHFTTQDERENASQSVFGRPQFVLPNGLDFRPFANLPARGLFRTKHPLLKDCRILLYLGRINYKKGVDVLIESFSRLTAAFPDLRLVIAGPVEQDMRDKLAGWLRASGVSDRILLTGLVNGSEKYELIADADLFVLSSHSENFGISVLEALAAGLPVVISDKVNICDEIAAADVGSVASVDATRFAEAVAQLLSDPARMRAMSNRARGFVRDRYDWDKIASRLEGIYRDMCHARARPISGQAELLAG